jgi:hypothetical protein
VTYRAASASTPEQWFLVGNGAQTRFQVQPSIHAEYSSTGVLVTSTVAAPNPRSGVTVDFRSVDAAASPVAAISTGQVQMPSNFSIRFSDCTQVQTYLCKSAATYSASLKDVMMDASSEGWVGGVDGVAGARYVASFYMTGTTTPEYKQNAFLGADAPLLGINAASSQLPVLDGALPTATWLQSGGALSWSTWAQANPHMKMKSVRLIATSANGVSSQEFSLPLTGSTGLTLSAQAVPADPTTYQLLMISQDHLGRYFYSLWTLPSV